MSNQQLLGALLKGADKGTEVKVEAVVRSATVTHDSGTGADRVSTLLKDEKKVVKRKSVSKDVPRITVSHGITKNLGNFESLRCDYSLSMPVGIEIGKELEDAIVQTKTQALALLERFVADELKALESWNAERKNKKESMF